MTADKSPTPVVHKAKNEEAKRTGRDPGSGLPVPESVLRDVPEKSEASGWSVVETFFGKRPAKGYATSGVGADGMRLGSSERYFKMPRDSQGNALLDARWASSRKDMVSKNKELGYKAAKVNPKGDLDPTGREVFNSGMQLMIRPMDIKQQRDNQKAEDAKRYRGKANAEAEAKRLEGSHGLPTVGSEEVDTL